MTLHRTLAWISVCTMALAISEAFASTPTGPSNNELIRYQELQGRLRSACSSKVSPEECLAALHETAVALGITQEMFALMDHAMETQKRTQLLLMINRIHSAFWIHHVLTDPSPMEWLNRQGRANQFLKRAGFRERLEKELSENPNVLTLRDAVGAVLRTTDPEKACRQDSACNEWQTYSGVQAVEDNDICSNILRLEGNILNGRNGESSIGTCWLVLAQQLRSYRAYEESAQVYQGILSAEFGAARKRLSTADQQEIERRVSIAIGREPLEKAYRSQNPKATANDVAKFIEEQKRGLREEVGFDLAFKYFQERNGKANDRYFGALKNQARSEYEFLRNPLQKFWVMDAQKNDGWNDHLVQFALVMVPAMGVSAWAEAGTARLLGKLALEGIWARAAMFTATLGATTVAGATAYTTMENLLITPRYGFQVWEDYWRKWRSAAFFFGSVKGAKLMWDLAAKGAITAVAGSSVNAVAEFGAEGAFFTWMQRVEADVFHEPKPTGPWLSRYAQNLEMILEMRLAGAAAGYASPAFRSALLKGRAPKIAIVASEPPQEAFHRDVAWEGKPPKTPPMKTAARTGLPEPIGKSLEPRPEDVEQAIGLGLSAMNQVGYAVLRDIPAEGIRNQIVPRTGDGHSGHEPLIVTDPSTVVPPEGAKDRFVRGFVFTNRRGGRFLLIPGLHLPDLTVNSQESGAVLLGRGATAAGFLKLGAFEEGHPLVSLVGHRTSALFRIRAFLTSLVDSELRRKLGNVDWIRDLPTIRRADNDKLVTDFAGFQRSFSDGEQQWIDNLPAGFMPRLRLALAGHAAIGVMVRNPKLDDVWITTSGQPIFNDALQFEISTTLRGEPNPLIERIRTEGESWNVNIDELREYQRSRPAFVTEEKFKKDATEIYPVLAWQAIKGGARAIHFVEGENATEASAWKKAIVSDPRWETQDLSPVKRMLFYVNRCLSRGTSEAQSAGVDPQLIRNLLMDLMFVPGKTLNGRSLDREIREAQETSRGAGQTIGDATTEFLVQLAIETAKTGRYEDVNVRMQLIRPEDPQEVAVVSEIMNLKAVRRAIVTDPAGRFSRQGRKLQGLDYRRERAVRDWWRGTVAAVEQRAKEKGKDGPAVVSRLTKILRETPLINGREFEEYLTLFLGKRPELSSGTAVRQLLVSLVTEGVADPVTGRIYVPAVEVNGEPYLDGVPYRFFEPTFRVVPENLQPLFETIFGEFIPPWYPKPESLVRATKTLLGIMERRLYASMIAEKNFGRGREPTLETWRIEEAQAKGPIAGRKIAVDFVEKYFKRIGEMTAEELKSYIEFLSVLTSAQEIENLVWFDAAFDFPFYLGEIQKSGRLNDLVRFMKKRRTIEDFTDWYHGVSRFDGLLQTDMGFHAAAEAPEKTRFVLSRRPSEFPDPLPARFSLADLTIDGPKILLKIEFGSLFLDARDRGFQIYRGRDPKTQILLYLGKEASSRLRTFREKLSKLRRSQPRTKIRIAQNRNDIVKGMYNTFQLELPKAERKISVRIDGGGGKPITVDFKVLKGEVPEEERGALVDRIKRSKTFFLGLAKLFADHEGRLQLVYPDKPANGEKVIRWVAVPG